MKALIPGYFHVEKGKDKDKKTEEAPEHPGRVPRSYVFMFKTLDCERLEVSRDLVVDAKLQFYCKVFIHNESAVIYVAANLIPTLRQVVLLARRPAKRRYR